MTAPQADAVACRLRDARRVAVLGGAGLSAGSGIPTFRGGGDSLWSRFDPMRLATPEAWQADPALVWAWYRWRMALVAAAVPNAGHRAIAALAAHVALRVVTQNVDDLHERAGSRDVVHVHGRLGALRCADCSELHAAALAPLVPADVPERLPPERCTRCGGAVRPGVVWFGEALADEAWDAAVAAMACDVLLVVGTSGQVQPAASLARIAASRGAWVVEINPERGGLSGDADLHWPVPADEALPAVVDALGGA